MVGGTAVLGLTFLVAVFRTVRKYANPKAKRQRVVNKNKVGAYSCGKQHRGKLQPGALERLKC